MAKQGMKRPETEHRKSVASYVPEIQGKAKSGKKSCSDNIRHPRTFSKGISHRSV